MTTDTPIFDQAEQATTIDADDDVIVPEVEEVPSNIDWTILEDQRVEDLARLASAKLAGIHAGITTADDLYQDATILLATNASRVRSYLTDQLVGERYVYKWLFHLLRDGVETDARRSTLSQALPTQ